MSVGDVVFVKYDTGEVFSGEVVKVRDMPNDRILFTVLDETHGYRSMYLDKCVAYDTVTENNNDSL